MKKPLYSGDRLGATLHVAFQGRRQVPGTIKICCVFRSHRDPGWWPVSGSVLAASAVSTMLRAVFLVRLPGFIKGDEVEVLEAAFRRAIGLEFHVWEIRNLFLPDLVVAPFVASAHWLGVTRPSDLILAATVPFLLAGAISTILVGALAERWGLSRQTAGLAAWLYGLDWVPLVYGSATFPRVVSTMLVLAAALALTQSGHRRLNALIGGLLAALACTCRYGEAIFLLPLGLLAGRKGEARDLRSSLTFVEGAALGLVAFTGLSDWLTWGTPLSSFKALLEFVSASFGSHSPVPTQPWYWYLWRSPHWIAPTAVLLAAFGASNKRLRRLLWFVGLPIVYLSLVPFKDYRYVQGVMPFAAILAAEGFNLFSDRFGRRSAIAVLAITLAWQFAGISKLQDRTAPAVTVSSSLSPAVRRVAFSQPWAYGGRLFLSNSTELTELSLPPRPDEIDHLPADCTVVSFYAIDESPELARRLEMHGFSRRQTVRALTGKPVVIYRKVGSSRERPP